MPRACPARRTPGIVTGALSLHASAVRVAGRGLLILGPSGAGKSTLALRLIWMGARLICDDRVVVARQGAGLMLRAPPNALAAIEQRGLGPIPVPLGPPAPLRLAVRLDRREARRLPPARRLRLLGRPVPVLHDSGSPAFAEALMQYLAAMREDAG
ncbi:MAG: HPr kinase/phosphorylase [Hasllibacter sp.]